LIRGGLATATPGIVQAGGRALGETGDHQESANNDRSMAVIIEAPLMFTAMVRRRAPGALGEGRSQYRCQIDDGKRRKRPTG
jgi:hypothetical protein